MNKKIIQQKESQRIKKRTLYTASRLEGKVKNTGIKNVKKKGKK
ncbi:MAG TPA: hypothetical protein PLK35_03500 [Candidatus Moranbacteria bacterium]|nr:hypothetical protein [Candidatus Moranbacteria bacterium]